MGRSRGQKIHSNMRQLQTQARLCQGRTALENGTLAEAGAMPNGPSPELSGRTSPET
jgi:hypothetical protein